MSASMEISSGVSGGTASPVEGDDVFNDGKLSLWKLYDPSTIASLLRSQKYWLFNIS